MQRWFLLALLASPAVASAHTTASQPPTVERAPARAASIIVESPDNDSVAIDRAFVELREDDGRTLVTLSLTLSSQLEGQLARMMVSLPHDAAVAGLTYGHGTLRMVATQMPRADARERLERAIETQGDPALLEFITTTHAFNRFELSLFPLAPETTETATLTIAMPRVARLLVDVAGRRQEVERSAQPLASLDTSTRVTPTHSLYAAPPPGELPVHAVRRQAAASAASLRTCYALASTNFVQQAIVQVTIGRTGRVRSSTVLAGTPELATCITRVVDAWQFDDRDQTVEVTYPLQLATAARAR